MGAAKLAFKATRASIGMAALISASSAFALTWKREVLRARFGDGRHYMGAQGPGFACHVVLAAKPEWGPRAFWLVPWVEGPMRDVTALSSLAFEIADDGSIRAFDDRGNGACNDPEAMKAPSPKAQIQIKQTASNTTVVRRCGGRGTFVQAHAEATFDSNRDLIAFRAAEWAGSLPWATFPKSATGEANCERMWLEAEF